MKTNSIIVLAAALLCSISCSFDTEESSIEDYKIHEKNDSANICCLNISSNLILDEEYNAESLRVTVKELTVKTITCNDTVTTKIVPSEDIREPGETTDWKLLPDGITPTSRQLTSQPIEVSYKQCFDVLISLTYIARSRDTKTGEIAYLDETINKHFPSVSNEAENTTMNIPITLSSISIDATIDNWIKNQTYTFEL